MIMTMMITWFRPSSLSRFMMMMTTMNARFMTIVDSVLLGWGSRAGDDRLGGGGGRD